MADRHQKWGVDQGGNRIFEEGGERGNYACENRSPAHDLPLSVILGNVMLSDASRLLDHAARQSASGGTHHAPDFSLGGEAVNDGNRELTRVRIFALQVQHLLNSPKQRSQQANAEDQVRRRADRKSTRLNSSHPSIS